MSWFASLFSGGIIKQVGGIIDGLNLSGEEKLKFKLDMEALLQKRESEIEQTVRTELQAKERIMVAELTQGDNYTKRARPTIIYAGLAFIAINYVIFPLIAAFTLRNFPELSLPTEFWYAWSGVAGTYAIGRSFEKRGATNWFTKASTGSKGSNLLE